MSSEPNDFDLLSLIGKTFFDGTPLPVNTYDTDKIRPINKAQIPFDVVIQYGIKHIDRSLLKENTLILVLDKYNKIIAYVQE